MSGSYNVDKNKVINISKQIIDKCSELLNEDSLERGMISLTVLKITVCLL